MESACIPIKADAGSYLFNSKLRRLGSVRDAVELEQPVHVGRLQISLEVDDVVAMTDVRNRMDVSGRRG